MPQSENRVKEVQEHEPGIRYERPRGLPPSPVVVAGGRGKELACGYLVDFLAPLPHTGFSEG
jgi:hypothetical protein